MPLLKENANLTKHEQNETAVDTVMTRVLAPAGLDEKHLKAGWSDANKGRGRCQEDHRSD